MPDDDDEGRKECPIELSDSDEESLREAEKKDREIKAL